MHSRYGLASFLQAPPARARVRESTLAPTARPPATIEQGLRLRLASFSSATRAANVIYSPLRIFLLSARRLACLQPPSSGEPVRRHGVLVAGGGLGVPGRPAHLSGERAAREERGELLPQDRPGHQALRRSGLRGEAQLAGAVRVLHEAFDAAVPFACGYLCFLN